MNLYINTNYNEGCLDTMARMDEGMVDLTITSPPYDNIRDYNGYSFDPYAIIQGLHRVTAYGGVVVWIMGDATINGSESGSSFRQALHFMDCGFKLHDTMIWNKCGFSAVGSLKVRYAPVFEYMFVFSKGKPKTFNPIKDRKNKRAGLTNTNTTMRQKDGSIKKSNSYTVGEYGQRFNIWDCGAAANHKIKHPAKFPESLVRDHMISWSNEGDLVFDPFMGSGTTAKVARDNNRNWVGSEISSEYCEIIRKRLEQ